MDAEVWAEFLPDHQLLVPWPCLYETLNTRFVRRREWLHDVERRIAGRNFTRFDDAPYREEALAALLEQARAFGRLSLTDLVIRGILADTSIRVDYLLTSNERDFADLRGVRGLELIRLVSRAER